MLTLLASLTLLTTPHTKIKTVAAWVTDLSTQLHTPIKVEKSLRDIPIFVQPHQASAQELLKAIGTALHATAVTEKTEITILRTASDIAQTNATLTAERTAWIEHRLKIDDEHRASLLSQGSQSEMIISEHNAAERERAIPAREMYGGTFTGSELLPETMLLEALLSRIGTKELAELPARSVAVYENNPPEGEKALPNCSDLIARYQTAVQQLDRSKILLQMQKDSEGSIMENLYKNWGAPVQVSKVRVSEFAGWTGIQFLIEIFDPNGHRLAGIGWDADSADLLRSTPFMLKTAEGQPGARWIQLSDANKDAIDPELDSNPEKLPLWYLHPTKVEPLNLFVSTVLEGMADEQPDVPTVIVATDEMWGSVKRCVQGSRVSLDALEPELKQAFAYEKIATDGTIVWRPEDPAFAIRGHTDRKALESFALSLSREGAVSLKSLCKLYSESNSASSTLPNAWSQTAQFNRGGGALSFDRSEEFLKLLAKIPDDAWDTLMASKPVPLSQLGLTADFSEYLLNDWQVKTEGGQVPDLYLHPPELLPTGPIPGAMVQFTVGNKPIIEAGDWHAWVPEAEFETRTMPPAGKIHTSLKDGLLTISPSREEIESAVGQTFRLGNRDEITIRFQLTGNLYVSAHVHGNAEPTTGELAFKDLPAEMKDKIWSNTRQYLTQSMSRWNHPWPQPPTPPTQNPTPPKP